MKLTAPIPLPARPGEPVMGALDSMRADVTSRHENATSIAGLMPYMNERGMNAQKLLFEKSLTLSTGEQSGL